MPPAFKYAAQKKARSQQQGSRGMSVAGTPTGSASAVANAGTPVDQGTVVDPGVREAVRILNANQVATGLEEVACGSEELCARAISQRE